MQHAILLTETPEDFARRSDATAPEYWSAWSAYSQAIAQAGVFVAGAGLMPPDMATTVRINGAGRQVQDGPYADTKEQLGGFFVIDVPDLDAALEWARKRPDGHRAPPKCGPFCRRRPSDRAMADAPRAPPRRRRGTPTRG